MLPGGKDRVIATLQDNQDLKDVDIFDVSNPAAPVLLAEQGLEDRPGAQASFANGETVFHHDMQHKRIGGHDFLLVSYWDAGQVLLNIDNPANPTFVGDSDYRFPDPLMPAFETPEGNSHQSFWDADNEFILSTDEDIGPFRTRLDITTGPNAGKGPDAGRYGAGEFGGSEDPLVPITSRPNGEINGPTIFGGRGCNIDPASPPASSLPAGPGEEKMVVFSRGACFFSDKVANGQTGGYDVVIIGQSHAGTRNRPAARELLLRRARLPDHPEHDDGDLHRPPHDAPGVQRRAGVHRAGWARQPTRGARRERPGDLGVRRLGLRAAA